MNRSVLYYRIPLFIGHVYFTLTSNILNSRVYGLKWRQRIKLTGTNAPHSHIYIDENNSDMLKYVKFTFNTAFYELLKIFMNFINRRKESSWNYSQRDIWKHFISWTILFNLRNKKHFFFQFFFWKKLLFWFKLK